jgi:LacI family transcriptional regulator
VRQALQHLLDLGHRKIAHIAGRLDMPDAILRLQGYQSFLRANRIPYREEWVAMGQFQIDGGRKAMAQLLDLPDRPTAVMCANDEMAIGAMLTAFERGLRVPEDVSVVGFDMTPGSANVYPQLTTVRQPIGELGRIAVRSLIAIIEGRPLDAPTVYDTELVVRASTASIDHLMEDQL